MRVAGKTALRGLAAAGAKVVVADLDEEAAESVVAALGDGHLAIGMDVTDRGSLEGAKRRILDRYGRLDVLVNNAAINDMFENPLLAVEQSMFEHYPLEMWDRSWKVNVSGVFLASQVLGWGNGGTGQREHYQYGVHLWDRCSGPDNLPEWGW